MTAYYNEHEPYAAQWLRNLIAAGHIAPGDVDARDIQDVTPDDLAGYTQCHFFAGIGGWSYALRLAGWPDDRPVWTGSCPCQPFSAAGSQAGGDDPRHLWPAMDAPLTARRPGDRFRAGKRLWSPEDDAVMATRYPHKPTPAIAKVLRRTATAVYARAAVLGLSKSPEYLASPAACRLRRGDNVGAASRFPKGHVPANKGLRRPGWGPGRMKHTQFRKGTRSGKAAEHYKPIGSTRGIDGYVYRKVSEIPNVPYTVNWKPDHVLLWTSKQGPVPPGHVIVFRNGNKTDIRIGNLECVSRRELMARNTIHNLPAPLAETIRVLGSLHRQIRRMIENREKQDRRSA